MAGYRDAECGWVMVGEEDHHEEELPKSSLRTALFLVIYATKRGILEARVSLLGAGGSYSIKFYIRRLCPDIQTLTLLYTTVGPL